MDDKQTAEAKRGIEMIASMLVFVDSPNVVRFVSDLYNGRIEGVIWEENGDDLVMMLSTKDMHNHYLVWCTEAQAFPVSKISFARSLSAYVQPSTKFRMNGKRHNGFIFHKHVLACKLIEIYGKYLNL